MRLLLFKPKLKLNEDKIINTKIKLRFFTSHDNSI